MNNLTPELIAKAKASKSAEELLELAKENGVELIEEEAKTFFEQLHANAELSDDELEAVSGGGVICENLENFLRLRKGLNDGSCSCCSDEPKPSNIPVKPAVDSRITLLPYESVPRDSNDENKIVFL